MGKNLKELLTLGTPLIISQLSLTASNFASHYILVKQGPDFLASLGVIGNSQTFMLQIPDSSLFILSNIVSHALGAGEFERIALAFKAGYVMAIIINVPQTLFLNLLPVILSAGGQPPKVIEAISIYAPWYTPGAMLITLNIVNKRFLAGMQKQNVILFSSILSSIVRGLAVYYLVPWGGIKGYALAENIYALVDFILPLTYLIFIYRSKLSNVKIFEFSFSKKEFFNLVRLGYPLTVKASVISGMVYYMDFLTGRVGNNALSVAGIVRQYYAWPLGMFVSLSDAVGILVSDAMSKQDINRIKAVVKNGLALNLTIATVFSITFTAWGRNLAQYFIGNDFSEDKEAIFTSSQSLFYVHIGWLLADAIRSVFDNFCYGLHKPKMPMSANLISIPFIFILTYVFGFMVFKGSVTGITLGACIASLFETFVLGMMCYKEKNYLTRQSQYLLQSENNYGNFFQPAPKPADKKQYIEIELKEEKEDEEEEQEEEIKLRD